MELGAGAAVRAGSRWLAVSAHNQTCCETGVCPLVLDLEKKYACSALAADLDAAGKSREALHATIRVYEAYEREGLSGGAAVFARNIARRFSTLGLEADARRRYSISCSKSEQFCGPDVEFESSKRGAPQLRPELAAQPHRPEQETIGVADMVNAFGTGMKQGYAQKQADEEQRRRNKAEGDRQFAQNKADRASAQANAQAAADRSAQARNALVDRQNANTEAYRAKRAAEYTDPSRCNCPDIIHGGHVISGDGIHHVETELEATLRICGHGSCRDRNDHCCPEFPPYWYDGLCYAHRKDTCRDSTGPCAEDACHCVK